MALEVWLDSDLARAARIGTLAHDRGQVRFHYDAAWLKGGAGFGVDPDLALGDQPFFPKPEAGNFGICGIARADIELTAVAFGAHSKFRAGDDGPAVASSSARSRARRQKP